MCVSSVTIHMSCAGPRVYQGLPTIFCVIGHFLSYENEISFTYIRGSRIEDIEDRGPYLAKIVLLETHPLSIEIATSFLNHKINSILKKKSKKAENCYKISRYIDDNVAALCAWQSHGTRIQSKLS